jgi:hypothetical protein
MRSLVAAEGPVPGRITPFVGVVLDHSRLQRQHRFGPALVQAQEGIKVHFLPSIRVVALQEAASREPIALVPDTIRLRYLLMGVVLVAGR